MPSETFLPKVCSMDQETQRPSASSKGTWCPSQPVFFGSTTRPTSTAPHAHPLPSPQEDTPLPASRWATFFSSQPWPPSSIRAGTICLNLHEEAKNAKAIYLVPGSCIKQGQQCRSGCKKRGHTGLLFLINHCSLGVAFSWVLPRRRLLHGPTAPSPCVCMQKSPYVGVPRSLCHFPSPPTTLSLKLQV